MKQLNISTPYGDRYKVNSKGEITQADNDNFSGQWLLRGIISVSGNEYIPFNKLEEWLNTKPQLLFRSGRPRYTVRDLDHGTMREWGNTTYHGIKSLEIIK